MSQMKRLQARRAELTAELVAIESKAAGFNRSFSGGELSKRGELAGNLRQVNLKIDQALAEDDLAQRVAEAAPAGMFAEF